MFNRKEAPIRSKLAEMETKVVEKVSPLVMTSPETSK